MFAKVPKDKRRIYRFKRADGSIVEASGDSAIKRYAGLRRYGWEFLDSYIPAIKKQTFDYKDDKGNVKQDTRVVSFEKTEISTEPPKPNYRKKYLFWETRYE